MKQNIFVAISAFSSIGLMSAGFVSANSSSENSYTGADSYNKNRVEVDQVSDQEIDNDSDIDNLVESDINTGINDSSFNIDGGFIDSGDAEIDGRLKNIVNTLSDYLCGNFGDVDWDLINSLTGFESYNLNDLDIHQSIDTDIDNDADVRNLLCLFSGTGLNIANANVGPDGGVVLTGDALAGIAVENRLNNSEGPGIGVEFGDVDVASVNDYTGAFSENKNYVDVNQDADVDIDNNADVENNISAVAVTGNNQASNNVGGGHIDTGDAAAQVAVKNDVNHTDTDVAAVEFPDVEVEAVNHMTGAESENKNDIDIDQEAEVDIDNDADIENNVEATASTGNNSADCNVGGGEVSTGDAEVSIDISNSAN